MTKYSNEFVKWNEKYHQKEIIDLKKHFSKKEFEILKKLNIEIKDKIYTEYEFELLNMAVMKYYKDDDMSEEELALSLDLEPTGVTLKEYNELIEKLEQINLKYNL